MHLFGQLLLVGVLAGFYPATCFAAESPRSVLILDQSGPGVQGNLDFSASLRSVLNATGSAPVIVYAESLDLNYFATARHQQNLKAFIREKYLDTPIRLIVTLGSAALEFGLQLRTDRWSDIPIVFAGVEDERPDQNELPNVTGRTMSFSLSNAVRVARIVVPDLDAIALVGDPLDKQPFRRHFASQLPDIMNGLTLVDLTGLPLRDVKRR